jgi:hypothetical protein
MSSKDDFPFDIITKKKFCSLADSRMVGTVVEMAMRRILRVLAHIHFRHHSHSIELFLDDWIEFIFVFLFNFCVMSRVGLESKVLLYLRAFRRYTIQFRDLEMQRERDLFISSLVPGLNQKPIFKDVEDIDGLVQRLNGPDLFTLIEFGSLEVWFGFGSEFEFE